MHIDSSCRSDIKNSYVPETACGDNFVGVGGMTWQALSGIDVGAQ